MILRDAVPFLALTPMLIAQAFGRFGTAKSERGRAPFRISDAIRREPCGNCRRIGVVER